MEFKDRFKTLRTNASLSYSQIAALYGKTDAAIRSWEAGRTKPDVDTLIKLAKYFGCTTDYLLGLSDVATPNTDMQSVCAFTQLSETAIQNILALSNVCQEGRKFSPMSALNRFIESQDMTESLDLIYSGVLDIVRDAIDVVMGTRNTRS